MAGAAAFTRRGATPGPAPVAVCRIPSARPRRFSRPAPATFLAPAPFFRRRTDGWRRSDHLDHLPLDGPGRRRIRPSIRLRAGDDPPL